MELLKILSEDLVRHAISRDEGIYVETVPTAFYYFFPSGESDGTIQRVSFFGTVRSCLADRRLINEPAREATLVLEPTRSSLEIEEENQMTQGIFVGRILWKGDMAKLQPPETTIDSVPASVAKLWVAEAAWSSFSNWMNNTAVIVQVSGPYIWVIQKWAMGENFSLLKIQTPDEGWEQKTPLSGVVTQMA